MKASLYGFLCVAALGLAACGDSATDSGDLPPPSVEMPGSASDVATSAVQQLDGITAAIESVHDEESARAAAQSIAQLNRELELLADATADMSDLEKGMAFARKAQDLIAAQQRMSAALLQLQEKPELMEVIVTEIGNTPSIQ